MKNYKIKVNSKNESKEAQTLFESLGCEKGACSLGNYPAVIVTTQDWETGSYCSTRALGLDIPAHESYKEITLAELRDMVVLKRNDVNDATHVSTRSGSKRGYITSEGVEYFWIYPSKEWKRLNFLTFNGEKLKPIIKPLKEYLVPQSNGKYALTKATEKRVSDWVEVPEGCNIITREYRAGSIIYFHWRSFDSNEFFLKDERIWSNNFDEALSDFIEKNEGDVSIIWQRPTQPEELPFIDDEPQSLNNQYAEIEQVRQHSHYKKDVSNLEFVDVYRVLKLFDVTDPCLQHAIKKLLCSGQRGAKSSDQDVQEAIDSLVRFQQMRIEDSLD